MSVGDRATVRQWLAETRLSADVQRNIERMAGSDDVRQVVVLPDVHLGRVVNNGCVMATVDLIYPEAVGGDIGCGFSAIAFRDTGAADVLANEQSAAAVMGRLYTDVPALKQRGDGRGKGGTSRGQWPEGLRNRALSNDTLTRQSDRDGVYQLGTLGRGNHFVELLRDDTRRLWLMVHSGSRGMGQHIASYHLHRATLSATGLRFLDLRTEAGQAYLNDMDWAVHYASVNRLSILARASEILGSLFRLDVDQTSYLDCPHNFARREDHPEFPGHRLMVHRKSANSARADEIGLIAGSAGTSSYVVRGMGAAQSLHSSSHGAGRLFSRTEARKRIPASAVRRQLAAVHYDARHVDDLRDEAPAAYRDIRDVMRAQRDLVRQEARLTPLLNFKHPDRTARG